MPFAQIVNYVVRVDVSNLNRERSVNGADERHKLSYCKVLAGGKGQRGSSYRGEAHREERRNEQNIRPHLEL